ncbi:MAG: NADH-quinone oxidoreductase subunit J [Deltaproteobacteria bacterium]|nr:NADH-quinone oxidoreductase subunit J [Deltaproteobacteria bacterium]
MSQILFYVVALLSLGCALSVILQRNPVYSALSLVGFLFLQAVYFVILRAYFLAVVQVLIYAGAIMVLFVYVVMVMNLSSDDLPRLHFKPVSIFLGGLFASILFYLFQSDKPITRIQALVVENNITEIAKLLFSEYVLAFEYISFLLVVAMVGVVVLNQRTQS